MRTCRPGGNRHGLRRLGAQDLSSRRNQLRQNQGRGRRRRGLEVVAGGGEGALQRCRQREAREPGVERHQAAAVAFACCACLTWACA